MECGLENRGSPDSTEYCQSLLCWWSAGVCQYLVASPPFSDFFSSLPPQLQLQLQRFPPSPSLFVLTLL